MKPYIERIAISIHAPREGRDSHISSVTLNYDQFQSTRPARGATKNDNGNNKSTTDFNPRAPRGARLGDLCLYCEVYNISIHAPREGRDPFQTYKYRGRQDFNPRAPRGARRSETIRDSREINFNPRAPRGARPKTHDDYKNHREFQSTRPARGATAKVNKFLCTFLQKRHGFQISLRKTLPFKAFCRLQIGKNFSICGANRCGNFCELLLRTIRSSVLPEGRSACSQNAQFYSHTFSRDNRNADCLFPDP